MAILGQILGQTYGGISDGRGMNAVPPILDLPVVSEDSRLHWELTRIQLFLMSFMAGEAEILTSKRMKSDYATVNQFRLQEQLGIKARFNDGQRRRLAAKAQQIGLKHPKGAATLVTPTILDWHQQLISQKYDSVERCSPARPTTAAVLRAVVVRIAAENRIGLMCRFNSAPRLQLYIKCLYHITYIDLHLSVFALLLTPTANMVREIQGCLLVFNVVSCPPPAIAPISVL